MSFKDGLVECSPLSSTCFVDWGPVTTAIAVIVALGVGVTPIVRDGCQRKRLAKLVAKISADELALMEHRLLVAAEVVQQSSDMVDHWTHKEVKNLIVQVVASGTDGLIPHVQSIPKDLEQHLANCIGLLRAFERTHANLEKTRPSEMVRMKDDREYYVYLAKVLNAFRAALCKWSKAPFEDLKSPIADGVTQAKARASDEMTRFRMHNPPTAKP